MSTLSRPDERPLTDLLREPGPAERNPRQFLRRRRWVERSLAVAAPVVLFGLWELAGQLGVIDVRFFPPPTQIAGDAVGLVRDGDLQSHLLISTRRVLLGFALGSFVGVVAGILLGISRLARAAFEPLLSALYTVPKLALLPLLLLIFGVGETPKILLIAITVFFFMWISTMTAIVAVPGGYREAATAFDASGYQMFRHVLLPAALPQVFVGLRLSAGVAVLVLVGAEFVQGNTGIGYLIWHSWTLFLAGRMYVGIIVVATLGVVFMGVVVQIGRWVTPWDRSGRTGIT